MADERLPDHRLADLAGAVALVTGGGSGIGRATARRLHAEGLRVCVVDRDPAAAGAVADEVEGVAVRADVSDPAQVDDAFATCATSLGAPAVAVLNAGVVTGREDVRALTDDEYRRILGVNVDGVVFGTRSAARAMTAAGGGVIVATASLAGIVAFPPDPVYALTKHAVVGFVRSVAPTLADAGIAVHAVCPGLTDTPLLGDDARTALGDTGFPLLGADDIAEAVVRAAAGDAPSGTCWVCQPGREPLPYEFRNVPGPRATGGTGVVPPIGGADNG